MASAVVVALATLPAQASAKGGSPQIDVRDLREWLTYIASDDLQGRAVFSAGLGMAASYIENHLREWGVKPAGDRGSYLQTVRVVSVKATSHSSVTVDVGGERRTFADGDGIRFPKNVGAKQQRRLDRVEFVGYGVDVPAVSHEDYRGRNVSGAAVIWLGAAGPAGIDQSRTRVLNGRNRYATDERQAAAVIGAGPVPRTGRGPANAQAAAAGQAARAGQNNAPDFTTTERLDHLLSPSATGNDAFFQFLFSHAPVKYADLKRMADEKEPLPSFRLDGVTLTFDINNDYEPVRTQLAQNVVGIIEGSDPQLKSSYVAFGAHYDHVGYADGELVKGLEGIRRAGAPGVVTKGAEDDRIWNGADDDGSGTVTLMAMARAFALGQRPKRSLLFVWHTGEERGLWGSLYLRRSSDGRSRSSRHAAEHRHDRPQSRRQSERVERRVPRRLRSDQHRARRHCNQAANQSLSKPLKLDYELNDPSDPESVYTRSDHYSYASKGIPIIFFTTGLHPDYHANTDEVSKIEFDKMTRIGELIYTTAARLANLDHAPVRDNQGPRQGRSAGVLSTTR